MTQVVSSLEGAHFRKPDAPPSTPRAPHRTGRRVAVAVGVLVVIAMVASLTAGVRRFPVPRLFGGSAPLMVDKPRLQLAANGLTSTMKMQVRNTTKSRQVGRAWWIVATKGDGKPWERQAYRSESRDVVLAPGATTSVAWTEDASVETGTYEVWGVVHTGQPDGSFVHSNAERVVRPVEINNETGGGLLRSRAPEGLGRVLSAEVVDTAVSPSELRAVITMGPTGAAGGAVDLRWSLVRDDAQPWATRPIAFAGDAVPVQISPDAPTTVELHREALLDPGTYRLVLRVSEPGETAKFGDTVFVSRGAIGAEGFDSSITRTDLPIGPAMIRKLAAPTVWQAGKEVAVRVDVRNLAPTPTSMRVWWTLAPKGAAAPWKVAVAGIDPEELQMAPRETRTVTLTRALDAPSGDNYELSAWVHTRAADGTWSQSDGVRGSATIRYVAGRLVLDRPSATLSRDGRTVTVRLRVVNNATSPTKGAVHWLLAPAGVAPPWDRKAYESATRSLTLPADGVTTVSWTEPSDIASGRYELWTVAHVSGAGGAVTHSDAKSAVSPLNIRNDGGVVRLRPATGPAMVSAATVRDSSGWPVDFNANVTIKATANAPADVALRWSLVDARDGADRWWTRDVRFVSEPTKVHVGAGSSTVVALAGAAPLESGAYHVRLTVSPLGASAADASDVVFVPTGRLEAQRPHSSVARSRSPVGAAMVRSLARPSSWQAGRPSTVNVEIRNSVPVAVPTRLFWYLAPHRSEKPFENAVAAGGPIEFVLDGNETRSVAVTGIPEVGGQYELSVWAHTNRDGTWEHSDGVHSARSMFVTGHDRSVRRSGRLPDVSVHRIAPTALREGERGGAVLTLKNWSEETQVVRTWWVLAPPDDDSPWDNPEGQAAAGSELTLAPGATVEVDVQEPIRVKPGEFSLSGWIHRRTHDGSFQPLDGVYYRDVVTVEARPA